MQVLLPMAAAAIIKRPVEREVIAIDSDADEGEENGGDENDGGDDDDYGDGLNHAARSRVMELIFAVLWPPPLQPLHPLLPAPQQPPEQQAPQPQPPPLYRW